MAINTWSERDLALNYHVIFTVNLFLGRKFFEINQLCIFSAANVF